MTRDRVAESSVRQRDDDLVAAPKVLDVREGRRIRRAMAGDVHEAAFAGKKVAAVEAGAVGQLRLTGAVDEYGVEADARDGDPAERLACARREPVRPCFRRETRSRRRVCRVALLVRTREAMLLDVRVERRERLLPEPDRPDPGEDEIGRAHV